MVTATRDRRGGPRSGASTLAEWGQRSVFGTAKGWPWWAAVVLALALSIIGAVIDMNTSGNLGRVYEGAYFLGCVAAVCLVRRRNVFGPMVQAPLILAVTIPVVVLLTKGLPSTGGTMSKLITLGVPLVTGFPTMAITTGATVLIGGIRYLVQRKPAAFGADDEDDTRDDDRGDSRRRPSDRDVDRTKARRSSGSSRSGQERPSSDDRDGARDRGRTPPSSRSRSEPPPSRDSRSASGRPSNSSRSSPDRDRTSSQDRDPGRDPRPARDRGQSPRSSQSRDRGSQQPRGSRSSNEDGPRQPPRRRDDDQ